MKFEVGDMATATICGKEYLCRIIHVDADDGTRPYLCSFGRVKDIPGVWFLGWDNVRSYLPASVVDDHYGEYASWLSGNKLKPKDKQSKAEKEERAMFKKYKEIEQQNKLVEYGVKNLSNNLAKGLSLNFKEVPKNQTKTALQNQIIVLRYQLNELRDMLGGM